MNQAAPLNKSFDAPQTTESCTGCGCTENRACIDGLGRPCYWVAPGVCSECV